MTIQIEAILEDGVAAYIKSPTTLDISRRTSGISQPSWLWDPTIWWCEDAWLVGRGAVASPSLWKSGWVLGWDLWREKLLPTFLTCQTVHSLLAFAAPRFGGRGTSPFFIHPPNSAKMICSTDPPVSTNHAINSRMLSWCIADKLWCNWPSRTRIVAFSSEPPPHSQKGSTDPFLHRQIANAHISVNIQDAVAKPTLFWKLWVCSKWWYHLLGHRGKRGEFDFCW